MIEDYWPKSLAHIPKEEPWAARIVRVAHLASFADAIHPGERRSYSVLVPADQIDDVAASLAGLAHEVSWSGRPSFPEPGAYEPRFWVQAVELPQERYEPLVLSWVSNDVTVLAPDPWFLMTYGLVPRSVGEGAVMYDDLAIPTYDVVEVLAPSKWDFPTRSTSQVAVQKEYLEDYLTLRGMALVEIYFESRIGPPDETSTKLLQENESAELRFPDRTLQLNRWDHGGARGVLAQVWGAKIIAKPGGMPISANALEAEGLIWPGYAAAINEKAAKRLGLNDYAYIDDAVLGPYEEQAEFRVSPETGSVSYGGQWSVGFCRRVGRNAIQLELRKLYEGAPPSVVRHWHRFAVEPGTLAMPEAAQVRNISHRSRDIIDSLVALGTALTRLAEAVGGGQFSPVDFVGLDPAELEYRGWWSPSLVVPTSRHVPLDLGLDAFLGRVQSLHKLVCEGFGERALRRSAEAIGMSSDAIAQFRSLKLLDALLRLAEMSGMSGVGLKVAGNGFADFAPDGTKLPYLFAITDLRNLGSHKSREKAARLFELLEKLNVHPGSVKSGYGAALDQIYDLVAAEVSRAAALVEQALAP